MFSVLFAFRKIWNIATHSHVGQKLFRCHKQINSRIYSMSRTCGWQRQIATRARSRTEHNTPTSPTIGCKNAFSIVDESSHRKLATNTKRHFIIEFARLWKFLHFHRLSCWCIVQSWRDMQLFSHLSEKALQRK